MDLGLFAIRPERCQRSTKNGGAYRDRTDDILLAKQALSQLSYSPDHTLKKMVGLVRFELTTSRLSSARSNQLSYKPLSEHPFEERETKTAGNPRC